MKKIIILLILAILLPLTGLAQSVFPVLPDKSEIYNNNLDKELRLINTYTKERFDTCLICTQKQINNPYSYYQCLENAELCLLDEAAPSLGCGTDQIQIGRSCLSADFGCKAEYGLGSYYSGEIKNSTYVCECAEGYHWNQDGNYCDTAACPDEMIFWSPYLDKNNNYLFGRCYTPNEICQASFTEQSEFSSYNKYGQITCNCGDDYEWNEALQKCEEQVVVLGLESENDPEFLADLFIQDELEKMTTPDPQLIENLKGYILLQVEQNGEAWYLEPAAGFRYYLSRPSTAFEVMRRFGLGVKHEIIANTANYPDELLGKIILDVETNGEAYYIYPKDKKAYYLGKPEDAFNIMQKLGLGISDSDIHKLPIAE